MSSPYFIFNGQEVDGVKFVSNHPTNPALASITFPCGVDYISDDIPDLESPHILAAYGYVTSQDFCTINIYSVDPWESWVGYFVYYNSAAYKIINVSSSKDPSSRFITVDKPLDNVQLYMNINFSIVPPGGKVAIWRKPLTVNRLSNSKVSQFSIACTNSEDPRWPGYATPVLDYDTVYYNDTLAIAAKPNVGYYISSGTIYGDGITSLGNFTLQPGVPYPDTDPQSPETQTASINTSIVGDQYTSLSIGLTATAIPINWADPTVSANGRCFMTSSAASSTSFSSRIQYGSHCKVIRLKLKNNTNLNSNTVVQTYVDFHDSDPELVDHDCLYVGYNIIIHYGSQEGYNFTKTFSSSGYEFLANGENKVAGHLTRQSLPPTYMSLSLSQSGYTMPSGGYTVDAYVMDVWLTNGITKSPTLRVWEGANGSNEYTYPLSDTAYSLAIYDQLKNPKFYAEQNLDHLKEIIHEGPITKPDIGKL